MPAKWLVTDVNSHLEIEKSCTAIRLLLMNILILKLQRPQNAEAASSQFLNTPHLPPNLL